MNDAAAPVRTFDFAELTGRERYKLLIGAVVPRPIALVTTIDKDGVTNAAPFSFFNCLSADPAILALGSSIVRAATRRIRAATSARPSASP